MLSKQTVIIIGNALGGGGAEKQMVLCAQALSELGWQCEIHVLARVERHERMEALLDAARAGGVRVFQPRKECRFSLISCFGVVRRLFSNKNLLVWTWGYRADILGAFAKM